MEAGVISTSSSKWWIWCGVAVALSTGACDRQSRATNRTADEAGSSAAKDTGGAAKSDQSPVTLTGCLQKGDGRTFILTEINSPQTSVGTSGSTASGAAVEREQMRAASHAYRLTGDDNSLDSLVGHQVRVRGTMVERADLPTQTGSAKAGAESARTDTARPDAAGRTSHQPPKIDEDDLAKVAVASIDSIADACGGGARKR
jgi:hypothetical protein